MSIAYLQGKLNTYLCYILERPPCEHFNATWLLVLYMLSICCLLGVDHPLHDQVGKDDFMFVNVSCLRTTSYYGYGFTCGYSKVRCYIEYVCCVLFGYLLLVIY